LEAVLRAVLSLKTLVLQALDVAQGLEYLHKQGIIHGDLKGVSVCQLHDADVFPDKFMRLAQHTRLGFREGVFS
jgi:serine/threonine protein kinase